MSSDASILGAGSRRDEQIYKSPVIDCEVVLERLGISNFSIDWDSRTVYVMHKSDLHKIADYFAFKLYRGAEGFNKYGWQWILSGQSKENKEGLH